MRSNPLALNNHDDMHTNILQVLETVILYMSPQDILLLPPFNRNSCKASDADQLQNLRFLPQTSCSFLSTLSSCNTRVGI